MIIDVHAHVITIEPEEDKRNILLAAERYGVSKFYVSGIFNFEWNPDEAGVKAANDTTKQFMKEHPDLISGYVYLNPLHKNTVEVLRRGIEEDGMSGVKVWMSCYCDDTTVFPVAEQLIEYQKPLLIHSFFKAVGQYPNETTAEHVVKLARRYPELKIIMAHLGGDCYHAIRAVKECPNVWVDISGGINGSNDVNYTAELLGAERILFGSDVPITFATPYGQILETDLPQEDKEKILRKNAAVLFGEKEEQR